MRRFVVFLALAGAACSSSSSPGYDAFDPRALGVDFTWTGVPPCSNVSPKITVYNAPAGTRRFRVELVDIDSAFARHGGGEVEARPGGVIPAGELKSYRGPCPSQQPIRYEMRVAALDASGQVLARGVEQQTYTPVSLLPRR
jgi:phosphatidylethanolamine-binding protein (PEBP) family uncharacterized protein